MYTCMSSLPSAHGQSHLSAAADAECLSAEGRQGPIWRCVAVLPHMRALSARQQGRLVAYLDEELLRIMRGYQKRYVWIH